MTKPSPPVLIKIIDESKIPLGEEETSFSSIKEKVKMGESLTKGEQALLRRLRDKANEWQRGLTSSADTERSDTMSG